MRKNKSVIIVGADGFIGSALSDFLNNQGENVIETTRHKQTVSGKRLFLDLSKNISDWIPPEDAGVAYFCASINSLDRCRANPLLTAKINVFNTIALAEKLIAKGIFVVFPSTNLVFNGDKPFTEAGKPISPNTEHGRQKAEAEKKLLAFGDSVAVVRFTKVFGLNIPLLGEWILELASDKIINPFCDKVVSPLPLNFIVKMLSYIGSNKISGILQSSADRDITYAEIGFFIADRLKKPASLVKPISAKSSDLNLEAVPANTTLAASEILVERGFVPPKAWPVIEEIIEQNLNLLKN